MPLAYAASAGSGLPFAGAATIMIVATAITATNASSSIAP